MFRRHARSQNGVASLAYVPGISPSRALCKRNGMAGTSPAMTVRKFLLITPPE
jgi:hypothetical protein